MRSSIDERITSAAECALADHEFVTAIDVFGGLGWLPATNVDQWRQGRVGCLEETIQVNPDKLTAALAALRGWATDRGLVPVEAAYLARTRDRRSLRFSESGDAEVERLYRTHWFSRALSDAERQRVIDKQSQPPDLVVIMPVNDWTCAGCAGTFAAGDLLLMEGPGPLCMRCAELDHLVYLPRGDAALTRRAKMASQESAIVVRYSRTRGRYERQGLLVEEQALAEARGPRS